MEPATDSIGHADQRLSVTEQSLAEEADQCLAKSSITNEDRETPCISGAVGGCIADKNRYRSQSPNDDKPACNKHLSIADELSQVLDEDTIPTDWTVNSSDCISGTACEGEKELVNVDVDGFEKLGDSTVADSTRTGATYLAYKPKNPSKLAFQLKALDQEECQSDPIPSRHASQSENRDSDSECSNVRDHSEDVEEQRPRRSRMDIWLEGIQGSEIPSSKGVHEEMESGTLEHRTAQAIISALDEHVRSSSDSVDEEWDPSLIYVQRGSRATSHSTRNATNEDDNEPKSNFEHDWSSHVDFDKDMDLQSLSPWTRVHDDNDIANAKPQPPPPPTPSSIKSAALEGNELEEFIKVSIFAVNAILFNKDKHTVSKIRDIQHLVEKVLVHEVCGKRKSFGDMLDRSAWRP